VSASNISRLVASAERCLLPLDQATTLPPPLFNDPEWFEVERTRVFHSGWVAAARSAELAQPNQFVTATIAGEPIVIVRTANGRLEALSNVCRHRSATIVGERSGSARSLQCPYHQWTYSLDGRLRAAPNMDQASGFDKAKVCLPRFAVDEWHGWVLVNVDSSAAPMSEAAPHLDLLFTEHRMAEVVSVGTLNYPSPWNWKISVENFLESYHHRGVHRETLEPMYPGAQSFITPTGEEPWTAVDHVSVVEGDEPFIALAMYPSLLIAITRGVGMAWFRLDPLEVDRSHLAIEVFLLPEYANDDALGDLIVEGLRVINDEDVPINERTAKGLRSNYAESGRVSHLEEATWHFRQWLIARMSD